MQNTYLVGLTGGIGAGKSAAGDWFRQQGIHVIDADQISREVVQPPSPFLDEIARQFGPSVIAADGTLDRRQLRDIVFADEDKRMQLEGILHPAIISTIKERAQAATSPYVVLESPLLFETRLAQLVHRSLLIDVSPETQVMRASARDQQPPEQIRQIMASQMPANQRRELAGDVVLNEDTLEALHAQLHPLHELYLKRAAYLARQGLQDTASRS